MQDENLVLYLVNLCHHIKMSWLFWTRQRRWCILLYFAFVSILVFFFLLPSLFLLLQMPTDSLLCCSHNSISFGKTRSANMLGWIWSSVDALVTRLWELDDITGKKRPVLTFSEGDVSTCGQQQQSEQNKCSWHFTLYIFHCLHKLYDLLRWPLIKVCTSGI